MFRKLEIHIFSKIVSKHLIALPSPFFLLMVEILKNQLIRSLRPMIYYHFCQTHHSRLVETHPKILSPSRVPNESFPAVDERESIDQDVWEVDNWCVPWKSKDQTLPIGSRESFTWIILKTILCLVLDFQGVGMIYLFWIEMNTSRIKAKGSSGCWYPL